MATDFGQNLQNGLQFNMLAFRNGFKYRNSDLEVIKAQFFATFCANLVKISPLNPKIRTEFLYLLGRDGKNRHIISNISASTGPNLARDDPSTLPGNDPFPRARMHHDRNAW